MRLAEAGWRAGRLGNAAAGSSWRPRPLHHLPQPHPPTSSPKPSRPGLPTPMPPCPCADDAKEATANLPADQMEKLPLPGEVEFICGEAREAGRWRTAGSGVQQERARRRHREAGPPPLLQPTMPCLPELSRLQRQPDAAVFFAPSATPNPHPSSQYTVPAPSPQAARPARATLA